MKLHIIVTIATLAFIQPVCAETVRCQVSGGVASAVNIMWTADSHIASATFGIEGEAVGSVTAVRPHNASRKVNLLLRPKNPLGSDEIEVLVVPAEDGKYRVSAVGYRIVAGVRHLNIMLGNDDATCVKQ